MIKNYIFDFGWVLYKFDCEYMARKYIKNEEDYNIVYPVVFDRFYWDRIDDGSLTDEQAKAEFCKVLPERLHAVACEIYDNWHKNLLPIDGMAELVKGIKAKGGKLYLLSNVSIGFAEAYKEVPDIKELLSLFDGLVFSGPLHIVKPSAEIFEHIISKYNLKREECMFIDDNEKNIDGAEAVGMKGYLFDGSCENLRKQILSL